MKSRWKWLIGILVAISFATLIFTTANRHWQPDFLQTLKATKTKENTYHFDNGTWITTRTYRISAKYADIVDQIKSELDNPIWQWSQTTIEDHYSGKKRTYLGWYINGPPHSFQIDDKPTDRTNPIVRLVWHETPGKMETYWIRFKNWLGFTPKQKK